MSFRCGLRSGPENGRAAASRRDGTPQMSPVAVAVDQTDHLLVSSRITAHKTRNLQRDPRAWLCVLPDDFFGRWIQIEGDTEIIELPDAMPLLIDYYRLVAGEHPDWDDYRRAMQTERRVVLRIRTHPRRTRPRRLTPCRTVSSDCAPTPCRSSR